MPIDPKLQKVMEMVKENIKIPIILEYKEPLSIDYLKNLGFEYDEKSEILPFIYGKATPQTIKVLEQVPFITMIYYSEPVYAA